jgi:hypothetical protein
VLPAPAPAAPDVVWPVAPEARPASAPGRDFSDDSIDFIRRDDRFVRRKVRLAELRDARFEFGDRLRALGVVFQLRVSGIEIREQRVVAILFELVRVSVEVDADDSLHAVSPSVALA